MALNTIVKVGGISNLSDARYCAGMGVQYLGFTLDSSKPEYVKPSTFRTIKEWVVGPRIVGELSTPDLESILQIVESYDIDCLEITHPEILEVMEALDMPVILKLDISAFSNAGALRETLVKSRDKVIFVILEKSSNSTIRETELIEMARDFKLMVGFINKNNLSVWLEGTDIYGIALKGGIETTAGFKDYDALADVLEALEVD